MKRTNENEKIVIKIFLAWQDQEEERWLEEMAAQGWLLVSYTYLRYRFVAAPPAEYLYRLDYKTTPTADMQEYLELFTRSGWEHVSSYLGWQYFRILKERFTVDIYSDKASRIEQLRRRSIYTLVLLIPMYVYFVLLRMPIRIEAALERYHLGFLSPFVTVLFILMLIAMIINGVSYLKLSQRIRRLKNEE